MASQEEEKSYLTSYNMYPHGVTIRWGLRQKDRSGGHVLNKDSGQAGPGVQSELYLSVSLTHFSNLVKIHAIVTRQLRPTSRVNFEINGLRRG